MTVFFKDKKFTSIIMTEYYGISGLLANIGGTFGLFIGFSLLSLVELIYFISIRLFFNIKKRNTNSIKRQMLTQETTFHESNPKQ